MTSEQHFIDDIVRLCPEVLLGRYLAVTSTDSEMVGGKAAGLGVPGRCGIQSVFGKYRRDLVSNSRAGQRRF